MEALSYNNLLMERVKVLEGERVSLVVPEKQDARLWYEGMNNIEIQGFLSQLGGIFHFESEEEYYEDLKKDTTKRTFCVYINESKKAIGNVGVFDISEKNRNAKLGVVIFDQTEQNNGYGTEAICLLLDFAFDTLGLHKVKLDVFSGNPRAISVYEKLGFVESGRRKEEFWRKDKYIDDIQMEIFQRDWKKEA